MLLTIDTFDAQGNPSSHTCSVSIIEDSANFLSLLIGEQHTLLSAYVHKGDNSTSLPLGAFTSSSVESIPPLLHHWQAILSASLPSNSPQSHTEIMIALTRRLINQNLFRIATHEQMISYFNSRIQQVQNSSLSPQSVDYINRENEANVVKHQQQVDKFQGFLERSTKRLQQLSV